MKRLMYLFLLTALCLSCTRQPVQLTILHTNDTHSQVEPKADGKGGYSRRMGYIQQERETDPDLIYVDAGDFWQGTPYFNFFNGRVEIEALNRMGCDAATLGNHEFDNGVDTMAAVLRLAQFPIVCCNYKVEGSPLEYIVKPYTIIRRKGLKIGIVGVGCNPESIIAAHNFAPLEYQSPLPVADEVAKMLKQRKHCDLVICLSHLGTEVSHGNEDGVCDRWLAENSRYIDLIIGGHTHQVVENLQVLNLDGQPVTLRQTGKSGVNIGKIVVTVE